MSQDKSSDWLIILASGTSCKWDIVLVHCNEVCYIVAVLCLDSQQMSGNEQMGSNTWSTHYIVHFYLSIFNLIGIHLKKSKLLENEEVKNLSFGKC